MRQFFVNDGTRVMRVGLMVVTVSLGWSAVATAQPAAAPQCHGGRATILTAWSRSRPC